VNTSFVDGGIVIDDEVLQEEHISKAQELLGNLVKEVRIEHEIVISKGNSADKIRQLALKEQIDVVIAATHGKSGFERLLIGSVTEKLIKILHCPLLVIRTKGRDFIPRDNYEMKLKKILVGCDFSADSKQAFDYGLSLAQEFQADIYLAHVIKPTEHVDLKPADYINVLPGDYLVWGTSDYHEIQQKVTEKNREKINQLRSHLEKQLQLMVPEECQLWCTPHATLLFGEPYRELIKYAKENGIDMIVLGVRGHTLWDKLMVGSTTDRVLREAPCPVLAVQPMEDHNK
jgi:nucleotide-binding universal stress UspA family protein